MEQERRDPFRKVERFFDKLEDRVRARLSRHPIVYSMIGGVAVVLFWRGVWMTADLFEFMTGPVSILISIVILLMTGLFVSFFVGDQILISGLKRDKKVMEKTEEEVKKEVSALSEVREDLQKIEKELRSIKEHEEVHHKSN